VLHERPEDLGGHTICVVVTAEFLTDQRAIGHDLTPSPHDGFLGLVPGDRRTVTTVDWRRSPRPGGGLRCSGLDAPARPRGSLSTPELTSLLFLFGSNTSPLRHHRIPSTPDSGSRIKHWGVAHHWAPVSEARNSLKIYDSQVGRCQPPAGRATIERSSVDGIESLVQCGHCQGQRGHVATGTDGYSRMLETFGTEEVERCALARRPPFEPAIPAWRAGIADSLLFGDHLVKSPKSAKDPRELGELPSIGARETETRGGRFADDGQGEELAHSRWGRASLSVLAGREP